jgi:hypothetical protein
MIADPVSRVLDALAAAGCRPQCAGDGWKFRSPLREDRTPSGTLHRGDDGRVLVFDHGDDGPDVARRIAESVGLSLRDLMPAARSEGGASPLRANGRASKPSGPTFDSVGDVLAELRRRHGEPSGVWAYEDAAGEAVGVVSRFHSSDGSKTIRPAARDASERWSIRAMDAPRPLYALPELVAAPDDALIVVCEGEKAADAAEAVGYVATTSCGGSKAAGKADWSPLKGHDVAVLPDHDEAGERYARDVSDLCRRAGARSVRVVRLADRWKLETGGDLADVLAIEGGDVDAVRRGVDELIAKAEPIEAVDDDGEDEGEGLAWRAFPLDALPRPFADYARAAGDALGCDPAFVAAPMLGVLAGAIGNRAAIELKRTWREPAIAWVGVIADSGSMKSPAIDMAARFAKRRQSAAMAEHAEAMREHTAALLRHEVELGEWKKAAKRDPIGVGDPPEHPETPHAERTWTDDATTEALATLLLRNPAGLCVIRDELSAWFDFDRYAGGKGGGDAGRWLEVFGGRALVVDRKTSGTVYVPRAAVSIVGGVQPGIIANRLAGEHRESGLAARFLLVQPPKRRKRWTEDEVGAALDGAIGAAFDRLYALPVEVDENGEPRPRVLTLPRDAKREWIAFYNEHAAEQAVLAGDEAAVWSKLEGYAARFALIHHVAAWAASGLGPNELGEVGVESVRAGVTLTRWFGHESRRVYSVLDEDDDARERRRLIEWIESRGGEASVRDVQRSLRRYANRDDAESALGELVAEGVAGWVPTDGGRGLFCRIRRGRADTSAPHGFKNAGTVGVGAVGDRKTE